MRRATTWLNQVLAENGVSAPWYMTHDEALGYWASRGEGEANAPSEYAAKDTGIVDVLHDFWQPHVGSDAHVLELGCNAGANLERLRQLGYRCLSGIEVNPSAVETIPRAFPDLTAGVTVGAFEDVLPHLEPVDVVFTMAVLMHVHPAAQTVFSEITRIAPIICTVELETASNSYIYPRNYRRVFERLGCQELRTTLITPETAPAATRNYDGCVLRLFKRA